MSSENPSGADNQQETRHALSLDPDWIVGFVDGEGCFSVSVHRNTGARRTGGWQLQPVFQVSQHRDHRDVLEALQETFAVGKVRPKGGSSSVMTYDVYALKDLAEVVVPYL